MLIDLGAGALPAKCFIAIMIICELYRQQNYMYVNKVRQVENRIVSLRQPHVRPIVRGKSGKQFEFGQKLALSVVNGYTFIERQSFDNFNEGVRLIESVERYKVLYGFYPEVVQADKIYRNKANLDYCKKRGIRLSGPKLGRPSKDAQYNKELEKRDQRERLIVEDRNGMAKRRFGLDLIMAILPETTMTEAAFQALCMNAGIRLLFLRLLRRWSFAPPFFPFFALADLFQ